MSKQFVKITLRKQIADETYTTNCMKNFAKQFLYEKFATWVTPKFTTRIYVTTDFTCDFVVTYIAQYLNFEICVANSDLKYDKLKTFLSYANAILETVNNPDKGHTNFYITKEIFEK